MKRTKQEETNFYNKVHEADILIREIIDTCGEDAMITALTTIADDYMWMARDDHNPNEARGWGAILSAANKAKTLVGTGT
jgi:hypothetical protein